MAGSKSIFCSGFFFQILPCKVRFLLTACVLDQARLCHISTAVLHWRFEETVLTLTASVHFSLSQPRWSLLYFGIYFFIPSKLPSRNCGSFSQIPFWSLTAQWPWSYMISQQMVNITRKLFRKTRWLFLKDFRKKDTHNFLWFPPHLWVILSFTMGIHVPSWLTGFSSWPTLCISVLD